MRRLGLAITAALILLAQGWALDRTAAYHSDTVDESTYLAGAARLARYSRDRINREHPPLTKWLMGQRLKAVEPAIMTGQGDGWQNALWDHPPERMQRNLLAARRVNIAMSLLTGLLLFGFVASRYGGPTGLIAIALWACSPLAMAHGSLATMEAATTTTTTWVAIAFLIWWSRPTALRAGGVGLAWGFAMLAKHSALILPVPALIAVLWRIRSGWNWRRPVAELVLAMAILSPLIVWSAYDFQTVRILPTDVRKGLHDGFASLIGGRRVLTAITPETGLVVPLYDHLSGIGFQAAHARGGHHNFLDGEVRYRGWWSFYLRSIAYETPTVGLILGLYALWGLRRRDPEQWALLALPAWWLLYFSLLTPAQGGLKYLLPVLPLWIAFVARALKEASERNRWAPAGVAMSLGLLAVSVHQAGPNYLMFFNKLSGGPSRGWEHLVHGKDWGQGQRQLGEWQRDQGVRTLWYARYSGNPESWGIRYRKPPCEPVSGWVAAHVTELQRPERHKPIGCLDWLKAQTPVGHFARSILLWKIEPSDLIKP